MRRHGRRWLAPMVIVALMATVLASPATAMAPAETWSRGVELLDIHADGEAAPNGGVYVVGRGGTSGSSETHAFLRSLDANGNEQWRAEVDAAGSYEGFWGVTVDAAGQPYAIGETRGDVDGASAGSLDTFVRAYTTSGATRWTDQFGSLMDESARAIAVAPDGSVYAAGSTTGNLASGGGGGQTDNFLRKYTAGGTVLWTTEFGGSDSDLVNDIAIANDGTVWVAGYTAPTGSGFTQDSITRISSGGVVLGTDNVSGDIAGSSFSTAWGITAHPSGGVVVGGMVALTTTSEGFLRRYAADGTETWTHRIDEPTSGEVRDLDIAADGTIIVSGIPFSVTFEEGFVGAYDGSGNLLWATGVFSSNSSFVVVTSDGGIVVHSGGILSQPGEIIKLAGSGGASSFTDVPAGAYYAEAVEWLKAEGVTTGVTATSYGPDDPVTRGQMAAFLHRLAGSPTGSPDPGFTDVPGGAFYEAAVAWLAQSGVTTGTGPTTYSPNDLVTRGQMAAFLHRLAGSPTGSPAHGFGDVPAGSFFEDAVGWLKAQGITTGTAPGVFDPGSVVTRAQMAAFMFRMATDSDWVYPG